MTEYRVFDTDQFRRALEKLDPRRRAFMVHKLSKYVYPQLRIQPRFVSNIKKLRGYEPETWRYRIVRFRLFFGIDESTRTVNVLTLDDGKDAYR
ncbi:MAG: hypothetical protein JW959_07315 [Pirellulales bacterium]|nr:hypothetical protein [Pirellulales bacterium]